MKLSVGLKVANSLSLTPQLQQAIRLLQLSSLELEQEIQQMTKAKTVRLVSPNQPVTMDYRIDRVTVTVDPISQIITQANCG